MTRFVASALVLLSLACQPAEMTDAQRAQVAEEIQGAADGFIAAMGTLTGDGFIDAFTDEADLVYVDGGRIYPDRDALKNAAGNFLGGMQQAGGHWDPAHVVVLGPDAGAFTGVFHADVVDTAGVARWLDGKLWTFVYQHRDGEWKIVQAHESNGRPAT